MEYRDHREIGKDLNLFFFNQEIGSGLPVYTENGGIMRTLLIEYINKLHRKKDYKFLSTPHIGSEKLFKRSGHLKWYKDSIFPPIKIDETEEYFLKPMNCPFHAITYLNRLRSYRELPLKFFELGTIYRYEASGGLYGLTRVRSITQDDSHIFCRKNNLIEVIHEILEMIFDLLKVFELKIKYIELSTYNKEKTIEDKKQWELSIATLKEAIISYGIKEFQYDNEGAAFYGPKISLQIEDKNKKTWQLSTIQLDLEMAANFQLTYKDKNGDLQEPSVVHRAILGSLERFIGLILENFQGNLPMWLAPIQLAIIPITDGDIEYLKEFITTMKNNLIRYTLYDKSSSLNKKLNKAYMNKIPYIVITGKKNRENHTLSLIRREAQKQEEFAYSNAGKFIIEENKIPV